MTNLTDGFDWDANPMIPDGFVCDSLGEPSPVELTTSWLATNLYEGCSFGCAYCFRYRWNPQVQPEPTVDVDEAAAVLQQHPSFRPDHTPLTVNVRSTDPLHPRVRESSIAFM